MTAYHSSNPSDHCDDDDEHAHTHTGSCHPYNVNEPDNQQHCADGEHEHRPPTSEWSGWGYSTTGPPTHGEDLCHPRSDVHCLRDGDHYHATYGNNGWCHSASMHPEYHEECSDGQHNHRDRVFPDVKGCHSDNTQHNTGELTQGTEFLFWGTGEIVCGAVGGAAAKVAKLIQKGASALRELITSAAAETGAGEGCGALWDRLVTEEAQQHEANLQQDHNNLDDSDTGDTNSETEPTDPLNYCSPWESFAARGFPNTGKVDLYTDGVSDIQYQGSRDWATARCEAALAAHLLR